MHRPCPNSAYNFYQASTGRVMGLSRQHDDGSHFLPPLVMAKRDGYDMLGLLVPNSARINSRGSSTCMPSTRRLLDCDRASWPARPRRHRETT